MISWRRAVMTPASCRWVSLGRMGQPHACDREHTEGMPDDKRQLGDLFALLAELHERRFSTSRIQEFRHPDENLAILLTDSTIHHRHRICETLAAHPADGPGTLLRRVRGTIAVHGKTAIMLLLCGSRGSLDLSLLLSDQRGVLLLMLRVRLALVVLLVLLLLLMLQPRGISLGVLMLVGEDVLALRLEHGEGG